MKLTEDEANKLPDAEWCQMFLWCKIEGTGERFNDTLGVLERRMAAVRNEKPVKSVTDGSCGDFAFPLIAGHSYFSCALPVGHDGPHQAGGTCFKHGKYISPPGISPSCPEWPDCVVQSSDQARPNGGK